MSSTLGNASVVLRSQTTLLASTFHALMHASDVPIRSNRSDLHSQSSDKISVPQYMVAFLEAGVDASYVHILAVPSREALAILFPDAEKRHRLIGLVCPKKVSWCSTLTSAKSSSADNSPSFSLHTEEAALKYICLPIWGLS